jgi:hypothetical protein
MTAASLRIRITTRGVLPVELDALLLVTETGEAWRSAVCSRTGCIGENHVEGCPVLSACQDLIAALNMFEALP